MIGNARRKQARESLSSVAPGTAGFSGSWNHTQIVQGTSMLKKRVVSSRHPPKCGTNDSGLSVPLAVPILAAISLSSSEPEDVNASGGKISIRTGGARIRTMARRTRRRAITRASLVVATRIRSTRTARGDATPVQHTPGTSAVVDLCSRRRRVNSALADQTSLTWPDEFPRKIERTEKPEAD